jgi:hypothetical protein
MVERCGCASAPSSTRNSCASGAFLQAAWWNTTRASAPTSPHGMSGACCARSGSQAGSTSPTRWASRAWSTCRCAVRGAAADRLQLPRDRAGGLAGAGARQGLEGISRTCRGSARRPDSVHHRLLARDLRRGAARRRGMVAQVDLEPSMLDLVKSGVGLSLWRATASRCARPMPDGIAVADAGGGAGGAGFPVPRATRRREPAIAMPRFSVIAGVWAVA